MLWRKSKSTGCGTAVCWCAIAAVATGITRPSVSRQPWRRASSTPEPSAVAPPGGSKNAALLFANRSSFAAKSCCVAMRPCRRSCPSASRPRDPPCSAAAAYAAAGTDSPCECAICATTASPASSPKAPCKRPKPHNMAQSGHARRPSVVSTAGRSKASARDRFRCIACRPGAAGEDGTPKRFAKAAQKRSAPEGSSPSTSAAAETSGGGFPTRTASRSVRANGLVGTPLALNHWP
mmetsp:Transcript_86535/g.242325  ORF Transcript_86535/g.242325 Transcript_86535/m.242325 type:complete len:236 (-) Transcript_86535:83-790(-)